ncbi:MAG: 1-acyl-sn-glycerol-3-phosphate acyltransferase [Armatimonadetes bacterium]|nr:1-acyl-sn-glycerol-3-phosphate acyltransferase [Armatimonadota bacterium]
MPPDAEPVFLPPQESLCGRWTMAWVSWLLQRFWLRVTEIDLPEADEQRLAELLRGPSIVCPNHPSLHEPVVIYRVLHRLRRPARYLTALDTMQVLAPLFRKVCQGCGVYSIRRGVADRQAFAATKQSLRDGRTVVIFPEGETYGLNDRLLNFQDGVVQMGFWGLQERLEAGHEAHLPIIPVYVKYLYHRPMGWAIDSSLQRLEARLQLTPPAGAPRYDRLRAVGFGFLRGVEQEFGIQPAGEVSLDEHIDHLFRFILRQVSEGLQLNVPDDLTLQQKLRRLFAALQDGRLKSPGPNGEDEPAESLEGARAQYHRELSLVQTFQAVRDGYVAEHPSAERYLDVLSRLEREVLGKWLVPGRRRALVRVGEPVDLGDHWQAYRADRKATVAAVTDELHRQMQRLVDDLAHLAPLVAEPHPEPAPRLGG